MTNRVRTSFILKEYAPREVGGKLVPAPFIVIETHSDLPGVAPGFMSLDLRPDVTFEQAREVTDYLNKHIESITHTPLSGRTVDPNRPH